MGSSPTRGTFLEPRVYALKNWIAQPTIQSIATMSSISVRGPLRYIKKSNSYVPRADSMVQTAIVSYNGLDFDSYDTSFSVGYNPEAQTYTFHIRFNFLNEIGERYGGWSDHPTVSSGEFLEMLSPTNELTYTIYNFEIDHFEADDSRRVDMTVRIQFTPQGARKIRALVH